MQIYEIKPENFKATKDVAACCVAYKDTILIVQRAPHKSSGDAWEIPGGKFEPGELPEQCARRELFEETKIDASDYPLASIGKLYVSFSEDDQFVLHLFKLIVDKLPEVTLSKEHTNYRWATSSELKNLRLVMGEHYSLSYYYR